MAVKVLLVEDDPLVLRMYERAFTLADFIVMTASDGTIVFETIKLNRPNVVVLDVMMPNFNGLETLEELKGDVATRGIPIIMLSAYDDDEIIEKAMQLGAAKYLVKNRVEPKDIVKVIHEVTGTPEKESDVA